ncbi:uncharacterized protein BDR25DRAFT_263832 [Lindgomyces ingoldianus]|uniref:Uncharacterized protein n=1 Tax=Lindgomyces ingoldianus TaxID=673940 RepID=A0ACB6QQR0_9PLEO|nr:uncharacterized protein BDR25DRAFT_263832 [Lindgomyces ingoldianus]KAF2469334.1 hypothetical protein BDR25DRAFT_263832 [Lindgomyces ingoldianus]
MPPPTPPPKYLYKILPSAPPTPLPPRLPLSDLDRTDGYIHLSTAEQVPGTAEKFFSGFEELWLLKIEYRVLAKDEGKEAGGDGAEGKEGDKKGVLKWEEVGRGCFAHFFGADLGIGNVESVVKVERGRTWGGLKLEW